MLRRTLLLVSVLFGISLMACEAGAEPLSAQSQKPAADSNTNKINEQDYPVIEAILLSLIQERADQDADRTGKVVLDPEQPFPIMHSWLLDEASLKATIRNTRGAVIPRGLGEALRKRNDWRYFDFNAYQPKDKRILVSGRSGLDDARFIRKYPTAVAFVQAWLPGYSEDGKTALVRCKLYPSDHVHGTVGTFLLTKQDDTWKVKWKARWELNRAFAAAARQTEAKGQTPLTVTLSFPSARMNINDAEFMVTLTNRSRWPIIFVRSATPGSGIYTELLDAEERRYFLYSGPHAQNPYFSKYDFSELAPGKSFTRKFKWQLYFNVVPKDYTRLNFSLTYYVRPDAEHIWGANIPEEVYLGKIVSNKIGLEFSSGQLSVIKPIQREVKQEQNNP